MKLIYANVFVPYAFQNLLVFLCIINTICGLQFGEENYYPSYFDGQQTQYAKSKYYIAIEKLKHEPQLVSDWPEPSVKLGQVSGVALDSNGLLLVFHRATKVWDAGTFSERNVYQAIGEPPIPQATVLVFNDTGKLVDKWGENLFHMPHGITVDAEGNVWLTDVALHQVFKFTKNKWQKPSLILGEKFVPGDDNEHFCKPSAVAVLSSGDFFVADGYCNSRIIKFAPDGTRILQWGKASGESPYVLRVPHALALAERRGLVCAADRERGRAACFRADNGSYVAGFSSWLVGSRLFSVAYAPVHGGRLYVVNGPTGVAPVRGYVIDFTSGRLIQTFAPENTPLREFSNPHDIVTSPDGTKVYVAELNPYRVYKFIDESLVNETRVDVKNVTVPVKPTATVEWSGAGAAGAAGAGAEWERWRGALGGAAAAAAAVLLALAALALLRARNRGRKGGTRRRWEYGHSEFKLRRLLERRRFTRVHSDDSDEEPAPMLPPQPPANA